MFLETNLYFLECWRSCREEEDDEREIKLTEMVKVKRKKGIVRGAVMGQGGKWGVVRGFMFLV